MTEGTVTRWLKNIGDQVAVDEPLLEVSTDKVDTEIPSPVAGKLTEILAVEDDVVNVGAVVALIGESAGLTEPGETEPTESEPQAVEPQAVDAMKPAPVLDEPTASGVATTAVMLPPLGESVTEGTVTRWLKTEGDQIALDEPLVEISTDKVDTELPSPVAGILTRILIAEDETVAVGATLALIGPATVNAAPTVSAPTAVPAPAAAAGSATIAPAPTGPLVRKLAREGGIDLESVRGSGFGGRVTRADLNAAPTRDTTSRPPELSSPGGRVPTAGPSGPVDEHTEPMPRLRQLIGERMLESLHVSPQLTTVIEVDVSRVTRLRNTIKDSFSTREGVGLGYLPFFVRAVVEALRVHPKLNASIGVDGVSVTYHDSAHIGIAVDTNRGLLVPVIHHAGDLTLVGLARRIAELAERTRTGNVSPDDLSGGTFSITNTGRNGALLDTPIINPPQVGILATGAVVSRPVVVTDQGGQDVIAIRSMAYFSLTYDHRLVDSAEAARFLATVKSRLEEGSFESELGA